MLTKIAGFLGVPPIVPIAAGLVLAAIAVAQVRSCIIADYEQEKTNEVLKTEQKAGKAASKAAGKVRAEVEETSADCRAVAANADDPLVAYTDCVRQRAAEAK